MSQKDYLLLYSQLINIGFDEDIALMAAQQSENMNEAIDWISNTNQQKKVMKEEKEEMRLMEIKCDEQDITKCSSLKQLISILTFYSIHHSNYYELNQFLKQYKTKDIYHVYHHLLWQ
eukprot:281946_1